MPPLCGSAFSKSHPQLLVFNQELAYPGLQAFKPHSPGLRQILHRHLLRWARDNLCGIDSCVSHECLIRVIVMSGGSPCEMRLNLADLALGIIALPRRGIVAGHRKITLCDSFFWCHGRRIRELAEPQIEANFDTTIRGFVKCTIGG
jgi:hypothetical protein